MHSTNLWRDRIVGLDRMAPLLSGRLAPYIHLDNAASTPALVDVVTAVERFLPWYSSVHRGTGYKSRLSTAAYENAREIIARFVGAGDGDTVIFGKNTTDAINSLASRYPRDGRDVVVTTAMEHHSNDLPWRRRMTLVRARVTREGRLDEDHLDRLFERYGNRVALLTVTGASNVTGFVQPIHRLASKAHAVGAGILVDAAQLAPHRRIEMKPAGDPEHLDFVALSAHKMYAPFGAGALIGCRDVFSGCAPDHPGGGTVDIVTPDYEVWADLPDREEPGSPNVIGAVAMAAAAQALMTDGMDSLDAHEASLTAYALQRLRSVPGLTIYGDSDPRAGDRIGVIAFNLPLHHALVAAIAGYEGGIGVRSGCFCAQIYVTHLLGVGLREQERWRLAYAAGDRSGRPGMVRLSLGAYNTTEDIDALVAILQRIALNEYEGEYVQSPAGDFAPAGYVDCPGSIPNSIR